MKIPVIAVVGPTASGKTALGIALAKAFNGEIVSADSMQIYKGMDIATAMPTAAERAAAVHHLVDFLPPEHRFSVAEYVELAGKTIQELAQRGKTPIVVGGTGLYIDSLLGGIRFAEEAGDAKLRAALTAQYDSLGGQALLQQLRLIDPDSADRLHPNDKRRIVRALEIAQLYGKSKTALDAASRTQESPYAVTWLGLDYPDRAVLYDRIERRVDAMVQQGLLEEAAAAARADTTAAQAIGHKELFAYFDGEATLEQALEKLKRETRRYAKRQQTWFRRNAAIHWIDCCANSPQAVIDCAVQLAMEAGFRKSAQ